MVCQNCQANVADDLVFCTECGSRLHEKLTEAKTGVMPESVVTQIQEKKPTSTLKTATITAGIFALLTVLGVGALLIFNPFAEKTVSQNLNTPKPSRTPTAKSANQNKNANLSANNLNLNSNAANKNTEKEPPKLKEIILDEKINLYADSSMAFSFTVDEDAKIVGKTEIISGERFEGYVFLQEVYDENGVKPEMKVFSFEAGEAEQFLPKGNYVLAFAEKTGKKVSLKARFTLVPQNNSNPAK